MQPETRYAKSGDIHIAYQTLGDGPRDLIYVPTWISQVEHLWEEPRVAYFFERLASFARLILFDRRGSGLSDPVGGAPTLEEQMDDVLAVMAAAGSERAALLGQIEGGPMAILFAATHPERTAALALFSTWARIARGDGYECGNTVERRDELVHEILERWGTGQRMIQFVPSSAADDRLRLWFGKLERLGASPGTARSIIDLIGRYDVRDILPTITVPTLVMTRGEGGNIDPCHSRYLADNIPGAKLIRFAGDDTLAPFGDPDPVLEELEELVTGARAPRTDRILATVLFTDIVGSTGRAAELGDRRWRELLARHDDLVRSQLRSFRGREIKSTGDGFLATFDGPARGIECARSIAVAASEMGLEIRAGLHTGECEVIGDDVGGLAVHIAARVSAAAAAEEVLVSSTVRDLVVGSGIRFDDKGMRELKGVPDEWRLFSVL